MASFVSSPRRGSWKFHHDRPQQAKPVLWTPKTKYLCSSLSTPLSQCLEKCPGILSTSHRIIWTALLPFPALKLHFSLKFRHGIFGNGLRINLRITTLAQNTLSLWNGYFFPLNYFFFCFFLCFILWFSLQKL